MSHGRRNNVPDQSPLSSLTHDAWLLFLTRFTRLFAYGALSVILVLYLTGLGLSESQTGLLFTLTLAGDTVISLFLTTAADRIGRRPAFTLYSFFMAGGLALITIFWGRISTSTPLLLSSMAILGIGTGTTAGAWCGGTSSGFLGAGADRVRARLAAEQKGKRSDQYRFSGAGLSGEDVEPLAEFELHRVYEGEILYREVFKHDVLRMRVPPVPSPAPQTS